MAKKNKTTQNSNASNSNSLDLSKGFSNGAFSSLKTLQDIRKSDAEDKKLAEQQRELQRIEAEKAAQKAAELQRQYENATGRGQYARFTEEDLYDTSNMSDLEIFEQSMKSLDNADLYTEKFNKKEPPKTKKQAEQVLTMTDEEREFALFTQEMAVTNVQRLTNNKKKAKHKIEPMPTQLTPRLNAAPTEQNSATKTDYVSPVISLTQAVKGPDILEPGDAGKADPLTDLQHKFLKEINRYQERFGAVITLKLRGYALEAAMRRLNDFMDSCINDKRQYALVICGKGLGSQGEPVIKLETINRLKSDDRVVEYVPVLNDDGDFGSVYIVFKTKTNA